MYHHLTSAEDTTRPIVSDFLWHKVVPLKVSLLALHLFCNWSLTKDNLSSTIYFLVMNFLLCCGFYFSSGSILSL